MINYSRLISVKNNTPVTTSLKVAKIFNKKHKNVIRKINNLVAQNGATKTMFFGGTYINRGRNYSMYYMNRDGFSLLVMGFTGNLATKFKIEFINAFDNMQKKLVRKQYDEFNRTLHAPKYKLFYKLGEIEKKNEINKPKVDYYNKALRTSNTFSTTVIAKDYGMSAMTLNKLLHNWGVIYKQGRRQPWIVYAKYQNKKLGSYNTYLYDKQEHSVKEWKWNVRGERLIRKLLHEHGFYSQNEQIDLLNKEIPYIAKKRIAKRHTHKE